MRGKATLAEMKDGTYTLRDVYTLNALLDMEADIKAQPQE